MRTLVASMCVLGLAMTAVAAPVSSTTTGVESSSLNGSVSAADLLNGMMPSWSSDAAIHPANTDPANQQAAFTDGLGRTSGLTGLLNDYNTSSFKYDFTAPVDIAGVNILTGNDGKDGRVFSTTIIEYSTDNGANFTVLGYFQSHEAGTENHGDFGSVFVEITDDAGDLMNGVTNLLFHFPPVDNTQGQYRDPYDGVNPYTGIDDGLNAAVVSPLLYEIDVIAVPEPASLALLAIGGLAIIRRR